MMKAAFWQLNEGGASAAAAAGSEAGVCPFLVGV